MARLTVQAKDALLVERRAQLLDAALRLLAERGFAATSVDAIAKAAGLAKGTVYLYFPTKEALLDALIERQSLLPDLAPLLERGAQLPAGGLDEAFVRAVIEAVWRALHARRELLGVLAHGGAGLETMRRLLHRMLPVDEALALALGARMGPARAAVLDPFVAVRGTLGLLVSLFFEQHVLGGHALHPLADEVVIGSVTELFLRGASARAPASAAAPLKAAQPAKKPRTRR